MIDPLNTSLAWLAMRFSRNKIEHVIAPADTSLASRSGLRYFLEVKVPIFPGASQFKRLVKMPGSEKPPVTENGSTVYEGAFFQLDPLLDGFLEYQKPAAKAAAMCVVSSLTMPYLVRESVENSGIMLANTEQPNQWLLKAGLTEEDFSAWGDVFFTTYMSQERPFLTWQPDGKQVSREQEEYLFFLLNCSPTPATVIRRLELTYTDGSVDTIDAGQLSGGTTYQVLCVPVGPAALGLNTLAKPVASYRIWLADSNRNRLSQVRSFVLDPAYRSQQRFILFANSLGGWDTLRLLGEGQQTLATERTTAALERPAGAPADFSELRVVYLEGSRSLQVSTGFFDRQAELQLRYLDELLLSKEIYLVSSRGHQALELLTSSLVDQEDNADLLARTFQFRLAAPVVSFSSLPMAPATPARPMAWRGTGVVQILDANGKRTGYGRPLKLQRYYADDGSTFKPITEKPNQPGDPDYVESLLLPGVVAGSSPYQSGGISRLTTFYRSTCGNGAAGEAASVVVPAGKYGSEIGQADADSKADAEYALKNSQAYADQYGTCTAAPELYQATVAAGQWRYRVNDGQRFEIYWLDNSGQEPNVGNTWDLQGQNRPGVYPRFSSDLEFPLKNANWRLLAYGAPESQINVKTYQNGALVDEHVYHTNNGGFEQIPLSASLASGDRIYLKVTQL